MDGRSELLAPLADKAPVVEDQVVELTVENGPAVGAEVLRALDAAQIPVAGLALREPSLDDVFLSLTGHKTDDDDDGARGGEAEEGQRPDGARRRGRRKGRRMTTIASPHRRRAPGTDQPGSRLSLGRRGHPHGDLAQPARR